MPLTCTVQQPHSPCPQLSRAPNSPKRCSSSTRLWCVWTSVEIGRPFNVKLIILDGIAFYLFKFHLLRRGERPAFRCADCAQDDFRRQRQFPDAYTGRIVNGVRDRRGNAESASLPH